MTIGSVASQPQQTSTPAAPAPAAQPVTQQSNPQPESTASASTPASPGQTSTPAQGAQPQQSETDWRTRFAGDDAKALEILSRYRTEQDFGKAFLEQRTALSKRAEPVRLAENATPEQIAEYRKGIGLPEIAPDSAPERFMDAYKIKVPDGYEATDFEKGMLSDFAKQAYGKGWSPAEVKGATDFFFQQQQAALQARNKVAVERQRQWQGALRDELGSREYDGQIAAANDWLRAQFQDDPDSLVEITKAELPGGGYLGDHPWFAKIAAKLAMADGFTDKIEANAYESSGQSLETQQRELEALYKTNRALYDDPKTQSKLDRIIALRLSRGEIDEMGRTVKKRRSA